MVPATKRRVLRPEVHFNMLEEIMILKAAKKNNEGTVSQEVTVSEQSQGEKEHAQFHFLILLLLSSGPLPAQKEGFGKTGNRFPSGKMLVLLRGRSTYLKTELLFFPEKLYLFLLPFHKNINSTTVALKSGQKMTFKITPEILKNFKIIECFAHAVLSFCT